MEMFYRGDSNQVHQVFSRDDFYSPIGRVSSEISSPPPGLQQQAVDFVGFLLDRYLADQRAGVELETLGKSFSASPVVKLTVEELMGMARQFFELPELDWRDADEILGYDEVGLPS